MSSSSYAIGYGNGEIEPKIAPLVDAVQKAGFVTFSSCEGHIDVPIDEDALPRITSIAFYAREDGAKRVHEFLLHYRDRLACSWCFRGGFVAHRRTNEFVLGWTLENCGIIEHGEAVDFIPRTVKAGWNTDIPMLVRMFADVQSRNAVS
jgi:tRNA(Phe) wybutosine-synthesizing methylase Tyw3